jgi:L-asparaginase
VGGVYYALMRIRILVTGGTFDKEYAELAGSLFFRKTQVPEVLSRGRCRLDVEVETVMLIDSLEMTADHRAAIALRCRTCGEHAVVITHGTDTMVETAHFLADAGIGDKTIVLTGAMIPYAFGSSDGLFNLGSALSFAQVLPSGVYIAMNGMHFHWDECRKNRDTGTFERTRP